MKAKIMNVVTKLMSSVAAMVLVTAVANANSTCLFWSYQPDPPEDLPEQGHWLTTHTAPVR